MKNVINVVGCGENLIQNGSLACESLIWITLFRKGLKRVNPVGKTAKKTV